MSIKVLLEQSHGLSMLLISEPGRCSRLEENNNAAPNMSLDAFMAEHTSEDNASFSEILEGINKRKRERYQWLHGQIEKKQVRDMPAPFWEKSSPNTNHD